MIPAILRGEGSTQERAVPSITILVCPWQTGQFFMHSQTRAESVAFSANMTYPVPPQHDCGNFIWQIPDLETEPDGPSPVAIDPELLAGKFENRSINRLTRCFELSFESPTIKASRGTGASKPEYLKWTP